MVKLLSYHSLIRITIVLLTGWVIWLIYNNYFIQVSPADIAYHAGNRYFQDGHYHQALKEYDIALQENQSHLYALRGKALTLLELSQYQLALTTFNQVITLEPQFAGNYANRGILYDRMGEHRKALHDYETALTLDLSLSEGPGWWTRFFRLQSEKPPTIAERAAYLKEQFAKPESERVLKITHLDNQQKPYQK